MDLNSGCTTIATTRHYLVDKILNACGLVTATRWHLYFPKGDCLFVTKLGHLDVFHRQPGGFMCSPSNKGFIVDLPQFNEVVNITGAHQYKYQVCHLDLRRPPEAVYARDRVPAAVHSPQPQPGTRGHLLLSDLDLLDLIRTVGLRTSYSTLLLMQRLPLPTCTRLNSTARSLMYLSWYRDASSLVRLRLLDESDQTSTVTTRGRGHQRWVTVDLFLGREVLEAAGIVRHRRLDVVLLGDMADWNQEGIIWILTDRGRIQGLVRQDLDLQGADLGHLLLDLVLDRLILGGEAVVGGGRALLGSEGGGEALAIVAIVVIVTEAEAQVGPGDAQGAEDGKLH
ncbi:hypothetical protein GP486_000311 [Trichoglossum hirsutum]|uniref:Uncharacterized protein n=1 Tax=Trichoglossum hirsutum TaxID=265104 RepID=A0A9P8LIT7_9PEZI|nr:hypothetical protein GP486_000311 [Trichoglossum hirsutum]